MKQALFIGLVARWAQFAKTIAAESELLFGIDTRLRIKHQNVIGPLRRTTPSAIAFLSAFTDGAPALLF